MIKTQIQLPDAMFQEAKAFCQRKEISFAELCRRSLEEYMVRWGPGPQDQEWSLPVLALGEFKAPVAEWRMLACEPEI